MVNDTTTLNGALSQLGETMAANITTKGVSASASDGLTTLAGKILQITGGGGSTIIFEDDCSVDKTNNYTSIPVRTSSASGYLEYDSTENAYALHHNSNSPFMQFGNVVLENNIKISADIKLNGTSWQQNGVLGFADKDNPSQYALLGFVQGEKYTRIMEVNGNSEIQTTSNTKWNDLVTNDYNHHELVYEDGVVTYTITTPNSATKTLSLTLQQTNYIGGAVGIFGENYSGVSCYVKNIKVERLGGGSDCSQYTTQINNAITYINGSGS